MENILLCINAVLPLFIIIGLGFAARQLKMLGVADVLKMNKIAFYIFMPFMMFSNIYQADLSTAVNPRLIAFAVVSVLAVFMLSIGFTLLYTKDKGKQGVIIQGIFRSNYVIIGLPIAGALVPGSDLSPVAILVAIVVTEFNVLAVISLSLFNGKAPSVKSALLNIVTNPLILSSLAGIAFLLLDIRLPQFLSSAVEDLSGVASPLMLFLLGAFIDFKAIGKYRRDLICVCTGRLLVVPAIFLTLGYILGFQGLEFAILIGIFASSAAVASFTMAQQMGGNAELAGDIVILTSALCPFTIFLWSLLSTTLGAI